MTGGRPSVVPERGVRDQSIHAALAVVNTLVDRKRLAAKKPWWKFW